MQAPWVSEDSTRADKYLLEFSNMEGELKLGGVAGFDEDQKGWVEEKVEIWVVGLKHLVGVMK